MVTEYSKMQFKPYTIENHLHTIWLSVPDAIINFIQEIALNFTDFMSQKTISILFLERLLCTIWNYWKFLHESIIMLFENPGKFSSISEFIIVLNAIQKLPFSVEEWIHVNLVSEKPIHKQIYLIPTWFRYTARARINTHHHMYIENWTCRNDNKITTKHFLIQQIKESSFLYRRKASHALTHHTNYNNSKKLKIRRKVGNVKIAERTHKKFSFYFEK